MAGMSNWLENIILVNYLTAGAPVYVAFHTADPNDGAVATEPVGGSYARILATGKFTVTANVATNNAELLSAEATASWGEIVYISLWTALSGGNMLYSGPVLAPKTIGIGDVARIKTGHITITND